MYVRRFTQIIVIDDNKCHQLINKRETVTLPSILNSSLHGARDLTLLIIFMTRS